MTDPYYTEDDQEWIDTYLEDNLIKSWNFMVGILRERWLEDRKIKDMNVESYKLADQALGKALDRMFEMRKTIVSFSGDLDRSSFRSAQIAVPEQWPDRNDLHAAIQNVIDAEHDREIKFNALPDEDKDWIKQRRRY